MNQIVRTITVTFLTVIYCLGINAINDLPVKYDLSQGSDLELYLSFGAIQLSSPSPNPEASTYRLGKINLSEFDCSTDHQWVKWQVHKKRFQNAFYHYFQSTLNILSRYRKSDIIFPFHYFW